jgi:flagellin-like protein
MKFITTTRNRKAVSPVIATLLLIAIAVAAAIIVYAFVTGLIGGLTGGNSGLIVESGTLSIPSGTAVDNNLAGPQGSLVLTIKNSGSAPIATVSVKEATNTAICDPAVATDPHDGNNVVCTADEWTVAAGVYTWAPIAGLPIPTGQTLSFSTPITGAPAGASATAGTTYSYTITVTFTGSTSNNIQTLNLVAQT